MSMSPIHALIALGHAAPAFAEWRSAGASALVSGYVDQRGDVGRRDLVQRGIAGVSRVASDIAPFTVFRPAL